MTEVVTATSRAADARSREAHPGFEAYGPHFAAALGPAPRLAAVAETDAHEGPVYVPGEDVLYFTSLPGHADISGHGTPRAYVKRLALDGLSFPVDAARLSVLPAPVHMPNGMTLGHDGSLVVCEQGTMAEPARISRVDPRTGQADGLVDSWGGLRLNSPNDVVVRRDGRISLRYTQTNAEAHRRLRGKFEGLLDAIQCRDTVLPGSWLAPLSVT